MLSTLLILEGYKKFTMQYNAINGIDFILFWTTNNNITIISIVLMPHIYHTAHVHEYLRKIITTTFNLWSRFFRNS